jgi:hypothetical protein
MINLINAVKNALRSFKLGSFHKTALSFLVVVILVATTACNGSQVTSKTNLDNPPSGKITELYKPITPEVGGMNKYSDVDPRVDTLKANAKAEQLVEKANSSQGQDVNPLNQIKKQLDRKGIQERVKETADGVSQSAQETVEGISKGTRKGIENAKENTKSFKDEIKTSAKNGY